MLWEFVWRGGGGGGGGGVRGVIKMPKVQAACSESATVTDKEV